MGGFTRNQFGIAGSVLGCARGTEEYAHFRRYFLENGSGGLLQISVLGTRPLASPA